jgi:hypothetical protein
LRCTIGKKKEMGKREGVREKCRKTLLEDWGDFLETLKRWQL